MNAGIEIIRSMDIKLIFISVVFHALLKLFINAPCKVTLVVGKDKPLKH